MRGDHAFTSYNLLTYPSSTVCDVCTLVGRPNPLTIMPFDLDTIKQGRLASILYLLRWRPLAVVECWFLPIGCLHGGAAPSLIRHQSPSGEEAFNALWPTFVSCSDSDQHCFAWHSESLGMEVKK